MLGNGAKNLSSNLLLLRFFIRHQSFACGEDGNTKSVDNGLHVPRATVDATTGSGDALDREFESLRSEGDDELLFWDFALHCYTCDPTVLFENGEKLVLDPGVRRCAPLAARSLCIADASEEIADGVVYGGHGREE